MDRTSVSAALAVFATLSTAHAAAKDIAIAQSRPAPGENAFPAEAVAVEISAGGQVLWSGRLRLGGGYANASYSQSINEYGDMCPTGGAAGGANRQSSQSLSFNINRANWPQEPDRFAINVSSTRPLAPCEGEGSNMSGFNRTVTVAAGQSVLLAGEGGLGVRVSRPHR